MANPSVSNNEKLNEQLKTLLQRYITKQINYNELEAFRNETDRKLFEIEGLCFVLQPNIFQLLTRTTVNILNVLISKSSVLSSQNSFLNLFELTVNELKNESQSNDKWKHEKVCILLELMLSKNGIQPEVGDRILAEYITILVRDRCDDSDFALSQCITNVLMQYPSDKIECWLMQQMEDSLSMLMEGKIIQFRNQCKTLCQVIWIILKFTNSNNNKCRILWNQQQLTDRMFDYLMKLVDEYCTDQNDLIVLAIVNLESMCVMKLINSVNKENLCNLLTKQTTNCDDFQIDLCARWCLDHVLQGQIEKIPPVKLSHDRFVARNDTQNCSPIRSALSVGSGVHFYEVTLTTNGPIQVGWSTRETKFGYASFDRYYGLGHDEYSICLDLTQKCICIKSKKHKLKDFPECSPGDVVGCLIDFKNRQFIFYLNGEEIVCSLINAQLSTLPYIASAQLSPHQQCHFNFGQMPFKFEPERVKEYRAFECFEPTKCQLIQTERTFNIFWFKHYHSNRVDDRFFCDQLQKKCDKLAKTIENDIKHGKSPELGLTPQINNCLRVIQSLIEVLQIKLKDDKLIKQLLEQQNQNLFSNKDDVEFESRNFTIKLFEMIFPYTQLEVNQQNEIKCHNVSLVIIAALNSVTKDTFPKNPYQNIIHFLASNNFISTRTFVHSPQLLTNALSSFDRLVLGSQMKRELMNNHSFVSLLRWCGQLFGHVDHVSRLYEANFDFVRFQAGFCAQWFLDHVLERTELRHSPVNSINSINSSSNNAVPTLNLFDKTLHLKLSRDMLSARCDFDEQSVRSAYSVTEGVFYYEAIVITCAAMTIGWAAVRRNAKNKDNIVGCSEYSIGVDCYNQIVAHRGVSTKVNVAQWKSGDVLGCLIDMNRKLFAFYLNGREIKHTVQVHCSSEHAYCAAASFRPHQQCYFNFGQAQFKYAPKSIQLRHLCTESTHDMSTVSNLSKCYPLREVLTSDRTEVLFDDLTKQKECDKLVAKHIEHNIFEHKIVNMIELNSEKQALRVIQSLIETVGIKLVDKFDLLAVWIDQFVVKFSELHVHFLDMICQVIYPYFSLAFTAKTATKHRIVCIVLSSLISTMKDLKVRVTLYKQIVNYLTQIVIKSKQDTLDEWVLMFVVISLEKLDLRHRDKETLKSNLKFYKELQSRNCFDYSICSKHYKLSESLLRQADLCSQWFLDHVLQSNRLQPLPLQATLNPLDRSRHMKLSSNLLSARSDSHWQNVRSTSSAHSNIFYYEVTLSTSGEMRIGWTTKQNETINDKVGDRESSIGFDGYNQCLWHNGKRIPVKKLKTRWKAGDVVGCMIDGLKKIFTFNLNEQPVKCKGDVYFYTRPYFSAISLFGHQQCQVNLGGTLFRYQPKHTSYLDFHDVLHSSTSQANQPVNSTISVNNSPMNKVFINVGGTVTTGDTFVSEITNKV